MIWTLVACASIWNATTRGALEEEVDRLLRAHGAAAPIPRCRMVDTTRAAHCLISVTERERGALKHRLSLHTPGSEVLVSPVCPGLGFPDRPTWVAPERSVSPGGATTYEYFRLYVSEDGRTCLELAYAYG